MTDVERRLRDLLQQHAQAAPSGYQMLARVRRTAHRRRRRRRLAGGLAMVLVLAGVGVAVLAGGVAVPRYRPVVGVGVAAPAPVTFVAGTPLDVTFPLTPGQPPAGGSAPSLMVVAGDPVLQYRPVDGTSGPMTVTVTGVPPSTGPGPVPDGPTPPSPSDPADPTHATDPTDPATRSSVGPAKPPTAGPSVSSSTEPSVPLDGPVPLTVEGQRAQLWRDSGGAGRQVLTWPAGPGRWVEVTMPLSMPRAALAAFASALRAEPLTQPGPFDFDLVPAGFVADNIAPSAVTFRPPGIASSPDFVDKLAVMLDEGEPEPTGGRAVTVAGRKGRIATADGTTMLRVETGAGRTLTVQAPAGLAIPEPDLLRFAAGIHVTARATPGKG